MAKQEGSTMQNIRNHRELRVYQAAMDAAMQIFELTKKFPSDVSPRRSISK
jgi:hypothetical protein